MFDSALERNDAALRRQLGKGQAPGGSERISSPILTFGKILVMGGPLDVGLVDVFARDKIVARHLAALGIGLVTACVGPLVRLVEKLVADFARDQQRRRAEVVELD